MKPGKPLRRRSALRPGGPLKRRTPIRRPRLRTVRAVVSAAERVGRKVVKARSGGLCECCGMRRATDWQHRKNRSQGGDWSASNGLAACRLCHRWIHDNPRAARARGWSVLSGLNPAEIPVRRRVDAWVLLADDGQLVPVLHYTGSPQHRCRSRHPSQGIRCEIGELHEGDHINGLIRWPVSSEERASV